MQYIRVTMTKVGTYSPDLSKEGPYSCMGVTSIEEAAKEDETALEEGEISFDEVVEDVDRVTYKIEVIDES